MTLSGLKGGTVRWAHFLADLRTYAGLPFDQRRYEIWHGNSHVGVVFLGS